MAVVGLIVNTLVASEFITVKELLPCIVDVLNKVSEPLLVTLIQTKLGEG